MITNKKYLDSHRFLNAKGNTIMVVMGILVVVGIIGFSIVAMIRQGQDLDQFSRAKLISDSILTDELKLMMNSGFCAINQLRSGLGIAPSSGGFPSEKIIFPVTGGAGKGLSSDSLSLEKGSLFDQTVIENIVVGPFDHRFDHQWEDVGSTSGLSLKLSIINRDKEYIQLSNEEYVGMLYVMSRSRASSSDSGRNLVTLPVLIKFQGGKLIDCRPVYSRGSLVERCQVFGGTWNDNTFLCEFDQSTANGSQLTCAVNDSCNVTGDYKL